MLYMMWRGNRIQCGSAQNVEKLACDRLPCIIENYGNRGSRGNVTLLTDEAHLTAQSRNLDTCRLEVNMYCTPHTSMFMSSLLAFSQKLPPARRAAVLDVIRKVGNRELPLAKLCKDVVMVRVYVHVTPPSLHYHG
jgi:hypothetical protein